MSGTRKDVTGDLAGLVELRRSNRRLVLLLLSFYLGPP
jgi:hypothetical protein